MGTLVNNEHLSYGGDDVTRCLAERFVAPAMPGFDPNDARLARRVEEAAERAKLSLSA